MAHTNELVRQAATEQGTTPEELIRVCCKNHPIQGIDPDAETAYYAEVLKRNDTLPSSLADSAWEMNMMHWEAGGLH